MIRIVGGWVFLLVPGHLGSPGQRAVKWLLLLFFCFCLFVWLRISQRRKMLGREILHAYWPTIQTGLFPFWWILARGESWRQRITSRMNAQLPIWNNIRMTIALSSKQISKPAAMLRGHSELEAAVSHKAVWWDLHLANLLTHLFLLVMKFLFVCILAVAQRLWYSLYCVFQPYRLLMWNK